MSIDIDEFMRRFHLVEGDLLAAQGGLLSAIRELPITLALNGFTLKKVEPADDMPRTCKMIKVPEADGIPEAWYYLIPAEDSQP